MNIAIAWCHRCGRTVPVEIINQQRVEQIYTDKGEPIDGYPAYLIQCMPQHHALLSVGVDELSHE